MFVSQRLLLGGAILLLVACTQEEETTSSGNSGKPKLLLSSKAPCQEPILPVFDAAKAAMTGETPVYLPLSMLVTGVSAKDLNQTAIELSYDPEFGQLGKFRSWDEFLKNASNEEKQALIESEDVCDAGFCSKDLKLNGSRITDAFYCTKKGPLEIIANISKLPNSLGKLKSNALEIICVDPSIYEEKCTIPVDMAIGEMGIEEMGTSADQMIDMEIKAPALFSLIFDNETNPDINNPISVQGSSQGLPTSKTIVFKVVDETQMGLEGVNVDFYLNWPGESCQPCDTFKDEDSCGDRRFCEWKTVTIETQTDMDPVMQTGCMPKEDLEDDEEPRCNVRGQRCEANICVAEDRLLPVSITPTKAISNADGLVQVTLVSSYEPGVFSVRAEAKLNQFTQVSNSPNITVRHGIPAQKGLTLNCDHSVIPTFASRFAPDSAFSANQTGYQLFSYQATQCSVKLSDRFTGRISENVPVFMMAEAGSVVQNLLTDNTGTAITPYGISDPPPMDVEPFVGELVSIVERPTPRPGEEVQLRFNPRDGLARLITFTQGEAEFIDINADGYYQPADDLVPVHQEPFVDANDNGIWDRGEAFYDVNRDQQWNEDVFERPAAMLQELRTLVNNIRLNPQSVQISAAIRLKNPSNLRTTIWTGYNLLWTGDIHLSSDDLVITCQSNDPKCSTAQNDLTPCGQLPLADVYLDLTGGSFASFYVDAKPKDANQNCLPPVAGNTIKIQLESEFTDSANIIYVPVSDGPNVQGFYDEDILLFNQNCFDQARPFMPLASKYKALISIPPKSAMGEPIAETLIMATHFTYKTFLNGESKAVETAKPFVVSICR